MTDKKWINDWVDKAVKDKLHFPFYLQLIHLPYVPFKPKDGVGGVFDMIFSQNKDNDKHK